MISLDRSKQRNKNGPTILFRTESFPAIGSGHVMRCLALGQWLRRCGCNVVFRLSNRSKAARERLRREGFSVHVDPIRFGGFSDAKGTSALADRLQANWVVVDGYLFNRTYVKTLSGKNKKILFIDDLGGISRKLGDVVLNPNPLATPTLYGGSSKTNRFLLGPRYALLRQEFWHPPKLKKLNRRNCRLLVTMGGSDPFNKTGSVLRSLLANAKVPLNVTVVLGPQNRHERSLLQMVGSHRIRIRFVRNVRNMAKWMAWADLAVSAAGGTSWELARMGCPMILLILASNQEEVAKALTKHGAALNAGWVNDKGIPRLAAMVDHLAISPSLRQKMALQGNRLVDGKGCGRVARALKIELSPVNVLTKRGKGIL
jgi:UDP-2,4-diacetamido-2,4,6-trideoxy-beta-L-altropyranose hydrolase